MNLSKKYQFINFLYHIKLYYIIIILCTNAEFLIAQTPVEGISKFQKGTIHKINDSTYTYEFIITEKDPRFQSNLQPQFFEFDDVFSWDTLTNRQYEIDYTFKFKNETKNDILIHNIVSKSDNFKISNKGKNIIFRDSFLIINLQFHKNFTGHFYDNISIYYGSKKYELGMWGFLPTENVIHKKSTNNFRSETDTSTLFLIDSNLKTLSDLSLKVITKDSSFYPEIELINNEFVYFLPLKMGDTIWYEVRSLDKTLLKKGFLDRNYNNPDFKNLFLSIDVGIMSQQHTYRRFFGPVKYNSPNQIYFIKWNPAFKKDEIISFLNTKGQEVSWSCDMMYTVLKGKKKAFDLQKEIIKSKYEIVLLPAFSSKQVNQFGWGGDCQYYDNIFTIEFSKNIKKKQIETIFKQYAITDFRNLGLNEQGFISYTFTLNTIIDLKFIALLDNLWNLPEVYSIDHQITTYGGND